MDGDALEGAHRRELPNPPKEIIPVHVYGPPDNMPRVMEIANRHGLHVIEDFCQSHGAAIGRRKTGGWGGVAAFSFYPTKNLGARGDGGMAATNDLAFTERVRSLSEYGRALYE